MENKVIIILALLAFSLFIMDSMRSQARVQSFISSYDAQSNPFNNDVQDVYFNKMYHWCINRGIDAGRAYFVAKQKTIKEYNIK